MINHNPSLAQLLKSGPRAAVKAAMSDVMDGMRNARSTDAHTLKICTSNLARATATDPAIDLMAHSKVDRGFTNDTLGRLLVPIDYLGEYDKDSTG